jgi:hypothetical protein
MKWYYGVGKPNDLPIDQDRNFISFGLVQCPTCGERRSDGVHISTMDPRKVGSPELRSAWRKLYEMRGADDPLTGWPFYEQFATRLKTEFPELHVSANMNFGVLDVEVERMVDIAGPGMGVVVIRKALLEWLISRRGLGLEGWPVKVRYTRNVQNPAPYLEIAARPIARALPGQGVEFCEMCQRSNFRGFRPGSWESCPCVLDESSVPPGVDGFRIKESPTPIIFSERFVEELQDHDGNIMWAEVKTSIRDV